jgi:hypothetical protein
MTAAEGSYLGFSKQTGVGVPCTADADFTYMLFQDGGLSPNNVFLPTEPEVGGGALQRNVLKAGVYSAGRLTYIPRPKTLGYALHSLLGCVTTTDLTGGAYSHAFAPLTSDQFSAPYYTARQAPGNLWGEQMQDVRFSALSLSWRGGNFLRAEAALIGGLPVSLATTSWAASTKVDGGPQFLAPLSKIEVPDATVLSVLSGSFAASSSIPLDEQWIVGSYAPQGLDIVQKAYMLSLAIKITDSALYMKIMYDPAAGSAWVANMFKEASLDIQFVSDTLAKTAIPYSLSIAANGDNAASGTSNVAWTAQPLNLRAGKQIVMGVTGMFLADHSGADPITMTLVNQTASY